MEFKKPIFKMDFDINNPMFPELLGKKVYKNSFDLETKKEREENEKLLKKWEEFSKFYDENLHNKFGHLEDYKGNFIRDVKLIEIIVVDYYKGEKYINTWSYNRDLEENRYYKIYKGIKLTIKNNHLYDWFSSNFIKENFKHTKLNQKLDDKGYITLIEDSKTSVTVNYGFENDLLRHEMKDVYVSTKGRYIKYKGKNYYIKEGN